MKRYKNLISSYICKTNFSEVDADAEWPWQSLFATYNTEMVSANEIFIAVTRMSLFVSSDNFFVVLEKKLNECRCKTRGVCLCSGRAILNTFIWLTSQIIIIQFEFSLRPHIDILHILNGIYHLLVSRIE